MSLGEDSAEILSADAAVFEVTRPGPRASATPIVFASPHSGRVYPPDFMKASPLDSLAIRRSEDAYVDQLLGGAPALGITLITARLARAFIDLNRDPWELDPSMFEEALPSFARSKTARVAAGLGAIPKVVGAGREIYRRKLSLAEARARIDRGHVPYHQALGEMLGAQRRLHGLAVLIDWHSMPSAAGKSGGRGVDIVLGDRFGAACAASLTGLVEQVLVGLGYRVARNAPYAGGYTSERHGRPSAGMHALQIEINRGLYLNESSLEITPGFERLAQDVDRVAEVLASAWPDLASV